MDYRSEYFCDGRLEKRIAQIPGRGLNPKPIDGRHIWKLDGQEITETQAIAFRTEWDEQ